MFGSITKHFKDEVIKKAIENLGKNGHTGLEGIGSLQYDYDKNVITMHADPEMVKRVREAWEENHRH